MEWGAHASDWPMADSSQFILCKPHKWHVQIAGDGPLILLIHGAGGATQSWRHLFPLLARTNRVVAIDLPGQGFTKLGAQGRCGLVEMAEDITHVCMTQGWEPAAIVGHSAGAAIALQMELSAKVIGINSALDTFKGVAGIMFPLLAKTLAILPMVADVFIATSTRGQGVQRLIDSTGSKLSASDIMFYRRLCQDRNHVNATLQMMAQWDLSPLINRLDSLKNETLLIATSNDQMVPADVSRRAAEALPNGAVLQTADFGHLAHEEAPDVIAEIVTKFIG
jgi:magnesium chelatase accessory protein